jgi:hypothetical protein
LKSVIARSEATKQSSLPWQLWIATRSLSSGGRSPDPLARNDADQLNQYVIGAGYVDDCFVLAANYFTSYAYAVGATPPTLNHTFMLQIGLRTIGTASFSEGLP